MDQTRTALPLLAASGLAIPLFAHQVGELQGELMLAVLLASAVSSIAGFAFSAMAGAMLFHLSPNRVEMVQIMMVCSIANQAMMTLSLRNSIDWREVARFLAGGLLGLPVGVWLLLHADRRLFTAGLGLFLLAYGAYTLFCRARPARARHPALDVLVAFLGGITGGAAAFPAGPVTVWCGLCGWDKARQRSLVQPYILIMQVTALLAINLLGTGAVHPAGFTITDLMFVPAGLAGTWLGMNVFRRMSNAQFALAVNAMLIVSGASFLL